MVSIVHSSSSMNALPHVNIRLQDEYVIDIADSVTSIMVEPVTLHTKSIDTLLKTKPTQDEMEPRPIRPRKVSVTETPALKAPLLPDSIKNYCDDYIAILTPLASVTSPLKKTEKKDYGSTSDASFSCVGYHAFQKERWMDLFQDLVDFYEKEGHFNVSYKSNTTLFQWVKRQRHQYKLRSMGQHSNLSLDRIQQLVKIGFVWNSHLAAWNDKFQVLNDFKKLHGHCFVPCTYKGTSKLSTWIKRQRRQYRKFAACQLSTLDPIRIEKLEKLGLVWDYYAGKDTVIIISSDEEQTKSFQRTNST